MIRSKSLVLALCLCSVQMMAQDGTKPINLDEIVSGGLSARSAGYGMRSMNDGEHYTMMNTERNAILRYSFATGSLVDTLFYTQGARECSFERFDDYQISDDGKHILIHTERTPIYRRSSSSHVFHYDVRRRLVAPLSQTVGKVMIPTFSPDGRMVAFVREGNIFIKKFDFDTEVQVTTDGARNRIINGASDWVYEEEFEVTNLMSWSEDGSTLAYVKTNETNVPEHKMQLFGGRLYPEDYAFKYPKSGEANSQMSVHLYNVADRSQKQVKLSADEAYYIPRIGFVGYGGDLAIMTLNRRQNHFRMIYVNNKTLIPKVIMEERSQTYIDSHHIQSIQFVSGGFAYVSERSGWAHLYLYSNRGQMQRQITQGNWDVTSFYGIDDLGNAYVQVADESPMRRNIYRIDPKGRKIALGGGQGMNRATFGKSFRYFIGTHSSLNTPTQTALYRSTDNKVLRVLEDNSELKTKLKEYRFSPKEATTIRTVDGLEFQAWIVKPKDFDPKRKYPLLMVQYSGPNSQMALDQYSFGWEYYLASRGIIVVCVDGRGTGARGEAWRKGTYLRLGLQESSDQIAAAKVLSTLPYIYAERIAIWGWSFGGYNTLMSMTRGEAVFKVGVAVAPVTDWKYYDTIYTERFMRTPAENPEGYRATSVLEAAHQLKGKLLLIHGSADDNVHVQHTMDLTAKLVEANIPFDMAIYTDRDHSIRGGNTSKHLYNKMAEYLLSNL